MFFDVVGKSNNLFVPVGLGNGDEDRFVESAANKFDLPGGDELAKALEIIRMFFFHPKQERAGKVQTHTEARVLFEKRNKRIVAMSVTLLQNTLKVPARLMRMNDWNEVERRRSLRHRAHTPS